MKRSPTSKEEKGPSKKAKKIKFSYWLRKLLWGRDGRPSFSLVALAFSKDRVESFLPMFMASAKLRVDVWYSTDSLVWNVITNMVNCGMVYYSMV